MRLPGGRGAGRRVRAGTRGGAGKPRRPRGGGDRVTGERRLSPTPHPRPPHRHVPAPARRGDGPGSRGQESPRPPASPHTYFPG